jgi:hypothetical protein
MAGEGDGSVTNRPAAPPISPDQAVHQAVDIARPALDLAGALLGSSRPHADAYEPRSTPSDQLGHMRTIAFRAGLAHEVAAMGGRGSAGAEAEDLVRVIRDGRMIALPGRGEEASRSAGTSESARTVLHHAEAAAHLKAALGGALSKEEMNLFERLFMAHFEGGIPIGEKLEAGQFKFLAKSEKAWMEFFKKFAPFTFEKKANLGDVQLLVFRGLVKDMPKGAQGEASKTPLLFLVSDMKFADGKTDKFARLLLQGQGLAQTMSERQPGEVLGKALLAQIASSLGGEEFSYLSLSHRVVNPDMPEVLKNPIAEAYRSPEQMKQQAIREGTKDFSLGIALPARTEQLIAEKLDINLKPQARGDLGDLGGVGRRGVEGRASADIQLGGGWLGGRRKKGRGEEGDESSDQTPYVPWWLAVTRPKQFKGKPRWWVPFLYFLAASSLALAAVYAFRYWMTR